MRQSTDHTSRFFITLAPCPHLNAKHTVFGHVVAGQEALDRIAKVKVDKQDKPLTHVLISNSGELERKKKQHPTNKTAKDNEAAIASSTSRGRHKRRHSSSPSHSRSPSPSRGHTRRSASRHRHRHRRSKRDGSQQTSGSATPPARGRRRSDASPDHNLRGRIRQRSRSQTPIQETGSADEESEPRNNRRRSPPPSRPRSKVRSKSPGHRRQRSLPNQYKDWRNEGRSTRNERDRDGDRFMNDDATGRLGGGGGGGGWDDLGGGDGGVKYKGRGAMKYQERDLPQRQKQGQRRW
jgi:peptidyl-prolyl isomerase G (cyclophilin G)